MKNDFLSIQIADTGAELTSIKDQRTGFEYLWQADARVWGRYAPILFPIVGKVKNNTLLCNGVAFPMNQHGFARDAVFRKLSETPTAVWYVLTSDEHTNALYPYSFNLRLGYELHQNTLTCLYEVVNPGAEPLYFSIGAHPGLNLPTANFNDYTIVFAQPETAERQLLSGGLFNGTGKPVFTTPTRIDLHPEIFEEDAIVLKNLNSHELTLKHRTGTFAIHLRYEGFPYMGIWCQKGNQQYICLEPWCGHADPLEGHEDISRKQGIVKLEPGETFTRSYALTFHS